MIARVLLKRTAMGKPTIATELFDLKSVCCAAMHVLTYRRVSTSEQADSGLGLAAQDAALTSAAAHKGWTITQDYVDAGATGSNVDRPGLQAALLALRNREADALAVAKLDRLSRSLVDFAGLMETARREGWAVIALDLGVDTSTPAGEMLANVLASFAQYERRLISQRTKDALAALRAQGVRLGRPRAVSDAVAERIGAWRAAGVPLARVAQHLNDQGVPTAHGGRQWYPSTVRAVLRAYEREVAA
jgi:DNA invertase Pin-like site-specific DNA recombinase